MKKILLLTIASVLLSGCHQSVLYKGILPAADCSGIEYSLRLDPGSGEYSLETTHPDADVIKEIHTGNHFSEDDILVLDDGSAFYGGVVVSIVSLVL